MRQVSRKKTNNGLLWQLGIQCLMLLMTNKALEANGLICLYKRDSNRP